MKRKLTFKQRKFVQEYIRTNGNGTKAGLRVYDTDDPKAASVIAANNLEKVSVREELDRVLAGEEYKLSIFTNKLASISQEEPAKGYSGSDIVEANKTFLKLHGVLTERKQIVRWNVNADLEKLSEYELLQLREKKRRETEDILAAEDFPDRPACLPAQTGADRQPANSPQTAS